MHVLIHSLSALYIERLILGSGVKINETDMSYPQGIYSIVGKADNKGIIMRKDTGCLRIYGKGNQSSMMFQESLPWVNN